MSTNNPNMDNLQNSPQFQEAVKIAVDKALTELLEKADAEEEKTEGCPYLKPVPTHWQTCSDNDWADPNKVKCIPPFWFMRQYFQNQPPPCWQQEQCQRPCRHSDGPGRVDENIHWQQPPSDCRPWWAKRNNDNCEQAARGWIPWWANRHSDACNNRPQQSSREWGPWWANRNNDNCEQASKDWVPWWGNKNADSSTRGMDYGPQQPPRDWVPWWANRNNDFRQEAPKEWVPWWGNRNADTSGRSGDNSKAQQQPKDWGNWWFSRSS